MKLVGTIVKWFPDQPKGAFGFVVASAGGGRYFLPASQIISGISHVKVGAMVRFNAAKTESKNPNALLQCCNVEVFDLASGSNVGNSAE